MTTPTRRAPETRRAARRSRGNVPPSQTPREDDDFGDVRWPTTITNQWGETVATYTVLTLAAKRR